LWRTCCSMFCLLALTPPLPSYSLPNPPMSPHTAVENNSIDIFLLVIWIKVIEITLLKFWKIEKKKKKKPRGRVTSISVLGQVSSSFFLLYICFSPICDHEVDLCTLNFAFSVDSM
jgi:hypothetical protein